MYLILYNFVINVCRIYTVTIDTPSTVTAGRVAGRLGDLKLQCDLEVEAV